MIAAPVLFLLAAQVQSTPRDTTATLPASPIARLEVSPTNPTMVAQDTLRLTARAFDVSGAAVRDVRYRFVQSNNARFEGRVDTTGLVRSGSTGTIPVTVIALVPGT